MSIIPTLHPHDTYIIIWGNNSERVIDLIYFPTAFIPQISHESLLPKIRKPDMVSDHDLIKTRINIRTTLNSKPDLDKPKHHKKYKIITNIPVIWPNSHKQGNDEGPTWYIFDETSPPPH